MGKDEWARFGWEASDPDTLLLDHKLSVKGFSFSVKKFRYFLHQME
jgi:hypothetical protein